MENSKEKPQEEQVEKTEVYEAPVIEVIEVKVEQGFQGSGPSRGNPSW